MEHRQPQCQHLVRLEEVTQIGPGIIAAHRTVAALTDGPLIGLVLLVEDVDGPLPGEELAVAAVSGGHHAVKKVHAPGHRFDDVAGSAHTHEVTGLVLGHVGLHGVDDLIHHFCGFAHGQAADGIAVAVYLGDLLHVPDPQVREGGALVDAEEHLCGVHRVRQTVEPVMRTALL